MASLLLALLLLSTAPAATATAIGQQQCEPNVLAKHVSAVCAPGKPTTRCCNEVIAIVDLPCLCRVAIKEHVVLAGLNASSMLQLYTSCGGKDSAATADFATGCAGVLAQERKFAPATATTVGGVPSRRVGCESRTLGLEMVNACEMELKSPSSTCCGSMFSVLGHGSSCLCNVSWESVFKLSPLQTKGAFLELHESCGGDIAMASFLHLEDVCAKPTADDKEKVCPPVVAPVTSKIAWVGWGLAVFFFAVLVSLILLLRGSRAVRVYTAERLAGREIGIVEIEDDDDQNVPLRRLPRALPAPAVDNDFMPRFLPARMSDSIRGADIVDAPAQLV
ncbi:hypothetical protein QYE76_059168 [Lolium multiflorum]|uniref:Bifunctional inhibitor/plant lipid transfer protein/seed storage helical domain-containing protein n=1 Tax=Lolium multiflorum TaxID=4521 RepID=A0AAD8PHF5_LOLMU|nr:hypothetical protein QYE76_059168 [Lolium multiflorum]